MARVEHLGEVFVELADTLVRSFTYNSIRYRSLGFLGVYSEKLRWPHFAAATRAAGFRYSHVLPLRLRNEVIGALNLFSTAPVPLSQDEISLAQALADIATIGLLQQRSVREQSIHAKQLQHALSSRILIEQAKGMLAERTGLDMSEAFRLMRLHARINGLRLSTVASSVINGTCDAEAILNH